MRYWNLQKGTSRARVRAVDHAGALERAAQIGFSDPDSCVDDATALRNWSAPPGVYAGRRGEDTVVAE